MGINFSRILVYANHTIVKYSFDYDIMTEWVVLFIATYATERERGAGRRKPRTRKGGNGENILIAYRLVMKQKTPIITITDKAATPQPTPMAMSSLDSCPLDISAI